MDLDPSGNHHSHRRRHFPPGFDDPPPGYSPSSEASLSVKLYVGKIPIGATEDEIRGIFGEYGNVTEVVLMKSRRNGEPLDCCFVKYGTFEEADRAIKTLNGRYTFPGAFGHPLKVRYADKGIVVQHKIYVCGLHRQATEAEIAQIFTPFGDVEEVFIIRGDMMQHRGCAFIQFTLREMAVAAINALNGSYTMWGCDLPLIVRFADPKKPRVGGGSRTRIIDQVSGFPNESHPNTPLSPNKRCKPHLSCVGNSLDSGFQSSSSSPYALFPNGEPADYADCDWSEHICPDGHPYYYNCVTNESRWEKPEEYAAYERELLKSEHQHQHMPHLEALSTVVVAQF